MNTRIIVDSTADVPAAIKNRLTIVPLTILFGDEEYQDGITISHTDFYEKLTTSEIHPSTSQPTPAAFIEAYEEAKKAGDDVIVITISSKLSGTYQSATLAAEDYENVFVLDSRTATLGTGILTMRAFELIDQGVSAKEIAEILMEERKQISLVAVFDTLEYLKRGGRISKAAAFAGGVLSIKPVIGIEDGVIEILGKARGNKQGMAMMSEEIQKLSVDFTKPVLFGYTGNSDKSLQKYLKSSEDMWREGMDEFTTTMIGSVIGTHAGPGAFAAAFFKQA